MCQPTKRAQPPCPCLPFHLLKCETLTLNSLLYGVNDGLLRKLQAVQNAAARVTTETIIIIIIIKENFSAPITK